MPRLRFYLLGKFNLTLDGTPVQTDRRKALAMLVYLALSQKPMRREHLADFFWPEFDREHAFAYLRRTLWEINQMLGEGWLEAGRELVELRQRGEIWLDAQDFSCKAAQAGNLPALEAAAALYEGDFMAGFSLRDSPSFEQWQLEQSETLRLQATQALGALSQAYAAEKRFEKAVEVVRRWLAVDALDEEAHRQLMLLHAASGRRSQALKAYQECQRLLEEELGARPEPATTQLYEQIRQGKLPSQVAPAAPHPSTSPASLPPGSAARSLRSHLPGQPTRFVGRAMELLEIRRLLTDPACRLLTLLGPGGIGKTRLSLEAASQLLPEYSQGAHFIALAPLSSTDLILPELACVLEMSFSEEGMGGSNDHLSQLLEYLRPRQLLLIMDNFEHLLQGAELVSRILAEAPDVKVLATSRERLNVPEEWIFEIEGMSYPVDERLADFESYSSVQLFISAARRNQQNFQLQTQDQAPVARICRLLQGMPLGIELAASWVRMLSTRQIAEQIEHNLDFLTSAQRGAPDRHRNLRAIFQHSWALLSEEDRLVYCKLAVFRGGFTHQAAEQVAGAGLPVLTALVDKSLVRHFSDGRLDLHEVLHHYARERLEENAALLAEVEKAHSGFYLHLLNTQQANLAGNQVKVAHAVLDVEFENLRQAWLTAVKITPAAELIETFFTLVNYIETRGRQVEGAGLVSALLPTLRQLLQARPQDDDLKLLLATSLVMLGVYELIAEHSVIAQAYLKEGMALLESLPPSKGKAFALILCGFGAVPFSGLNLSGAQIEDNYRQTLQTMQAAGDPWGLGLTYISHPVTDPTNLAFLHTLQEETQTALEIFTRLGSVWGQAFCYNRLSQFVPWRSNLQEARDYALKAAAIYRELGDAYRLVSAQLHLGQVETALGEYDRAKAYYEDNLRVVSQLGRRYYIAVHQDAIGYIELLQGNFDAAEKLYQASLVLYQELENEHGIGMSLANLGDVALRRGDPNRAEQLLQEGLEYQLAARVPWGIIVCLKKLGLVAFNFGRLEKATQRWQQALGLALRFTLVSEALETLVYFAGLDGVRGQRARALQTLEIIRGNPAMPREVTGPLEKHYNHLVQTCTPDELAQARRSAQTSDVRRWIEEGLGITPLDIDQISAYSAEISEDK